MKLSLYFNYREHASLVILFCATIACGLARAADNTNSAPVPKSGASQPALLFNANKVHSLGLKRQVNAGSRGSGHEQVTLAVLAPDGLGLASQNQPSMWWYLSKGSTNEIEFTLNHDFTTLVKTNLPGASTPGLHQIDLSQLTRESSVKLEPDTYYEWTIRLRDGGDPATQPVSRGWIQWVAPDANFVARLGGTTPAGQPALYAREGYWYDAIHLLAASLRANPGDIQTQIQLQSLLDQTGLKEVQLPK